MSVFDNIQESEWKTPRRTVFDDIDPSEWGGVPKFSFGRLASQVGRQAIQGVRDVGSGLTGLEQQLPQRESVELNPKGQLAQMRARSQQSIESFPSDIQERREKAISTIGQDVESAIPKPYEDVPTGFGGMVEQAVGGAARFAPSMVATAVNAPVGAAATFTQIYGSELDKYDKMGVDKDRANTAAVISAIGQTPIEFAGNLLQINALGKIVGGITKPALKRLATFGRAIVQAAIGEGAEEYLQAYPEAIADIYAENKDISPGTLAKFTLEKITSPEFQKQAGKQAVIGSLAGSMLAGAGGMVGEAARHAIGEKTAEQPKTTQQQILSGLQSGEISIDQANEMKARYPDLADDIDTALSEYSLVESPEIRTKERGIEFPKHTGADQAAIEFEIQAQRSPEQQTRLKNQAIIDDVWNEFNAEQVRSPEIKPMEEMPIKQGVVKSPEIKPFNELPKSGRRQMAFGPGVEGEVDTRSQVEREIQGERRINGERRSEERQSEKTVHTMPDGTIMEGSEHEGDITGSERPVFKTTNEAVEYGQKATPEQITELELLETEARNKEAEYRSAKDFSDDRSNNAYQAQLYREALEASMGEHPAQIKNVVETFREAGTEGKPLPTTNEFNHNVSRETLNKATEAYENALEVRNETKKFIDKEGPTYAQRSGKTFTPISEQISQERKASQKEWRELETGKGQVRLRDTDKALRLEPRLKPGQTVYYGRGEYTLDEISEDGKKASIFGNDNKERIVPVSRLKTEKPETQKAEQKEPSEAIGKVWTGNQWKPIVGEYQIKKGKNKGKLRVTFKDGSKKLVDFDAIRKIGEKIKIENHPIVKKLSDESGSSEIAKDVFNHGVSLIDSGTKTFREFRQKMRQKFADVWDKIKTHIRALWDYLKSERGSIEIGPKKDAIDDFVAKLNKTEKAKPIKKQKGEISDKKQTQKEAAELIRQRRFGLNIASYRTNKFLNEIEKETTALDRETLPFIIEKTDIPKSLNRSDIEKNFTSRKKNLNNVASKIKRHFNKSWEKVKEHIPEMSDKQIENYVTHIWDIPKSKKNEITNWFTTQNRFLKKRYIPTLFEGIEKFGLKPKVLDIAEIIRIHDSVTNKAIENAQFVEKLNELRRSGKPLAMRSDKAPPEWVQFNHPALSKNLYIHGSEEDSPARIVRMPIKVHPDLAGPMKVIFDDRGTSKVARAYDIVNGLLKKTKLSISLFHHLALGETGVATMGLRKTAGLYINPRKIWKALAKNEYDVFEKQEIAEDAIKHGVQIGATKDIPVNKIQRALNRLAKKTSHLPLIRQATRFGAKFNETWDKALWTYLHDSLKLYGYEAMVSKADPSVSLKKQKEEIAQLINDTFGGQNWDTLMVSDKTIQIMSRLLLSPDWTLSTARQAIAPFGFGKVHSETASLRKRMGRRFWVRAIVYFGVGINLLNMAFRKKDKKDNPDDYPKDMDIWDYTMFGNTSGHKTHLFVGRYKDGTERYIRWGKQFREIPELLYDDVGFSPVSATIKKIGGKAAPLIQLTSQTLTGVSPSGFRNDDIYGQKGWDRTIGIAKTLMKAPLPFSSRYVLKNDREWHVTDIALPSSKGMSKYKASELFKVAIRNKDERMVKEVYQEALRNKLPAFTVFKYAITSLKIESTKELSDGLNTIEKIQNELKKRHSATDRRKLRRRLKRKRKERRDFEKGMQTLRRSIRLMEKYNKE